MNTSKKLNDLESLSQKGVPTKEDVSLVYDLIQHDDQAARFFFEKAKSASWAHLVKTDILQCSTDGQATRIIVPYLLHAFSNDFPQLLSFIVEINGRLDEWGINQIMSASLNFTPEEAIQLGRALHDQILKLGTLGTRTLPNYVAHVGTTLPEETYALDLIRSLVEFHPDPDYEKIRAAKNNPDDEFGFYSSLEPKPRFDAYGYHEFLDEGVLQIAKRSPALIAEILIEALSSMIPLRFFDDSEEFETGDDHSEIWCQRIDQQKKRHLDQDEVLAQACYLACELVYKTDDQIQIKDLDLKLRESPWLIFKRIRQNLYAKFPRKVQMPWFQEFIREPNRNYGERNHHFDFQRMLESACKTYGSKLFDEGELEGYLEAILSGPDKQKWIEGCKSWNGFEPTDEDFIKRQAYFHRTQLHPFADVLYGEYKEHYETLESEALANGEDPTTDDDYYPIPMKGGTVRHRSPQSVDEMSKMTDDELLQFLNDWNDPQHYYSSNDDPVDIDFGSLSGSFKKHVLETISRKSERLIWWLENANKLTRPLYCGAIVQAIADLVEAKQHEHIKEFFDFCDWILEHEDSRDQHFYGKEREDANPDNPSWSTSRAAVRSFATKCISAKAELSQEWRERVFALLKEICTSKDALLEEKGESHINKNAHSLVSTAINRTRSQALEDLFDYANWVRRATDNDTPVPEVIELIDQRYTKAPVLTDAEQVLLAMHFGHIRWLDSEWAKANTRKIFPRNLPQIWQACFSAYLTHSGGYLHDFQYLKPEYLHAFTTVALGEEIDKDGDDKDCYLINKWMGYHLLTFYLSGQIQLTSEDDLCMEFFYKATQGQKELWGDLFNHIGRSLSNWGPDIAPKIVERVKALFEWRIQQEEPKELSEYLFWLDGACLEPKWRMEGFLRTLPFTDNDDVKASMITDKLHEHFLESHPDMVLQCFAEVTKLAERKRYFYVSKESAIPILKVGLASQNKETKAYAKEARENLLKAGRFEYLHLEEEAG
jgi:hypothetical protein